MLEVEGGDHEWCMRILRHEAGHAIDNAYQLRRRADAARGSSARRRRRIPSTTRRSRTARASCSTSTTGTRRAIPTRTSPRRSPCGSTPRVEWRDALRRLAGAAQKLEYMDRADARRWRGSAPRVTSKRRGRSAARACARRCASTTGSKREHYGLDHPDFYDRDLRNLFSDAPRVRQATCRPRSFVAPHPPARCAARSPSFTDSYQYTIDQVLEKIIERCRELNLRLDRPEEQATTATSWCFSRCRR